MTEGPVRDTAAMIAGMAPVLDPGPWHFVISDDPALTAQAFAVIREEEGQTLVLSGAAGGESDLPMARITLTVHSALDGVGLTAAVATALAEAGIPCNMIAGYHHDHAFVPVDQAEDAMGVLKAISGTA